MAKDTLNPPDTNEDFSPCAVRPQDDAVTRALDFYLKPKPKSETSDKSDSILRIDPSVDSECLLVNLSENLASANVMISHLVFDLDGPRRHVALGFCR